MKTSAVLASVGMLLLAGCAATSTVTWSKAGANQEQGTKDLNECAGKANLIHRGSAGGVETLGLFDRRVLDGDFEKCMTGKGYKKN